jgi:hypothetical protein
VWLNPDGDIVCLDPAPRVPGENALVIDAEAFQKALESEGLVPYWLVRGEKLTLGGRDEEWAGHHLYHYFCWLDNGKVRHRLSTTLNKREVRRRKQRQNAKAAE